MFGKPQINNLYLEALTLEVLLRYVISFSVAYKLSVYIFIGLHCLLPESATRVEVFCKKGVPKIFVNFIGKHLCWSLFLIKLQAWHLFWRTSAKDRFCTALAPFTVTCPIYFIFSTFVIITNTTVNNSDVSFWFKFERLQRI